MAVAYASAFQFCSQQTFRQIWRTVRQKKMDYRALEILSEFINN